MPNFQCPKRPLLNQLYVVVHILSLHTLSLGMIMYDNECKQHNIKFSTRIKLIMYMHSELLSVEDI